MAQIKITLTKCPIGCKQEQRKTVVTLGLGKLKASFFFFQAEDGIRDLVRSREYGGCIYF